MIRFEGSTVRRDSILIGATLMVVGGILVQIALSAALDPAGWAGVGASAVGLLVWCVGSRAGRIRGGRTARSTDRRAVLGALGVGAAGVVVGVMLVGGGLVGAGFAVLAAAAALIGLSEQVVRSEVVAA